MSIETISLVIGTIGAIPAVFFAYYWLKRKLHKVAIIETSHPNTPNELEESVSITFPDNFNCIFEKINFLEMRYDYSRESETKVRNSGRNARDIELQSNRIKNGLYDMQFLQKNDVIDNRYYLLKKVGNGRASVVWKAYDRQNDIDVAIKFLKYEYFDNKSTIECFGYSAKVMDSIRSGSVPAVLERHKILDNGGKEQLHYYVMDYVEGVSLKTYICESAEEKIVMIERLIKIAESLSDAHKKNTVHRDIKPNNILVEHDGTLKLVDFDAAINLTDCYVARDVGTFGYAAPEVLSKRGHHGVCADVFSLARTIIHILYGKEELPNPYEKSNESLIDFLDCSPVMKETLRKATSTDPGMRFQTMSMFAEALKEAIIIEKEKPALFSVLNQERQKVYEILVHSFLGTLAVMLVARSLLTEYGSFVHLSDRLPVAIFHSVIGSFVWGVFIAGAFLCYFVKYRRNDIWGYIIAMFVCGLGGFVGGIVCAIPSVYVTNPITLQIFGWLPASNTSNLSGGLLWQTAFVTKMLWSFPVVGFFTGAGLGLCLNLKTKELLMKNIRGITPIPVKNSSENNHPFKSSVRFILLSPLAHLFLLFPVIFSGLLQFIFNSSPHLYSDLYTATPIFPDAYKDMHLPKLVGQLVKSEEDFIAYQEIWRSLGEGTVHYLGGLGLMVGFFWGVVKHPNEEDKV